MDTVPRLETGVIIVGGGASGIACGLASARLGVKTLIIESSPWLGGMLTAAGVSAVDGNEHLRSGIWGEFQSALEKHYGTSRALQTGWVSNTLFEPSVGNAIFQQMAKNEPNLSILFSADVQSVRKKPNGWVVEVIRNHHPTVVMGRILVDATELGDLLPIVGARYRLGLDSRKETGEPQAPLMADSTYLQDLTYVMTLKEYGIHENRTIPIPIGYDSTLFTCSCNPKLPGHIHSSCPKMMDYGRLPHHKYMINWPICGNDYTASGVSVLGGQKDIMIQAAKLHALQFLYYLQSSLGYKNLDLADDEFPTADRLPFTPYYRESRRVVAKVFLTANLVANPYHQNHPYYRTGIAVGDYPMDHHYNQKKIGPYLPPPPIPSFTIPLGCLIPERTINFLSIEKSIGVSNLANGATRLQPVVLLLGQAAGVLASLSVKGQKRPDQIGVRAVQKYLLLSNVFLQPYVDVQPSDPDFIAVQKIGSCGILKGFGQPGGWQNKTFFKPDSVISCQELSLGFNDFFAKEVFFGKNKLSTQGDSTLVGPQEFKKLVKQYFKHISLPGRANQGISELSRLDKDLQVMGSKQFALTHRSALSRRQLAVLINRYLNPFQWAIDLQGERLELDRHSGKLNKQDQ